MEKRIETLIRQVIKEQMGLAGALSPKETPKPGVMLGYGSKGEEVKELQRKIASCGVPIKETGVFDGETLSGLMKLNKGTSDKINSSMIPTLCKSQTSKQTEPTSPLQKSKEILDLQPPDVRRKYNGLRSYGLSERPIAAFVSGVKTGGFKIFLSVGGFGSSTKNWKYVTNCQLIAENKVWNQETKKYEKCEDDLKNKINQKFCK
jgi:hypothetical protein